MAISVGIVIVCAILSFTLTNIDDFCVLVLFYSRLKTGNEKQMTAIKIAAGQTLGFAIICAFSLLGIILGQFLPVTYVQLIGFVPIIMGLKMLKEQYFDVEDKESSAVSPDSNGVELVKPEIKPPDIENNIPIYENMESTKPVEDSLSPDAAVNVSAVKSEEGEEDPTEESFLAKAVNNIFKSCLNPCSLEVATMTVANGGDNIAIYLPLFASYSIADCIVTIIVFYVMLVIWVVTTYYVVEVPVVAEFMQTRGSNTVPWFLMALGIYILSGSPVFKNTAIYTGG